MLARFWSPSLRAESRESKPAGRTVNRRVFLRGRRDGDVKKNYIWTAGSELGSGSFGKVFKAKSVRDSNRAVAVKQVKKTSCDDLDELWREIGLLEDIDHPHVLRFQDAYEDYRHIYIVTELCLGGDLFNFLPRIQGNINFASRVSSEVLSALAFCHSKGFCHRDLKMQNILLLRPSQDSPIRVADFGLASQVHKKKSDSFSQRNLYMQKIMESEGKFPQVDALSDSMNSSTFQQCTDELNMVRLHSIKGTPEYMAPEIVAVLNAKVNDTQKPTFYDFRCDVWSLGVVIHVVLTGQEPFTLQEIAARVEFGTPLREPSVQDLQAASFLQRCFCVDYNERPTSLELLYNDPWVQRFLNAGPEHAENGLQIVRERLHNFTNLPHFKRAALTAAARRLSPYEQEELRCFFRSLDSNCTGKITLAQLSAVLPPDQDDSEDMDWVIRAFAAMDTDLSGEVDYIEFLAAVMDSKIENRKDLAWAAFSAFDMDGSGTISRDELAKVLEDAELQKLLDQVAAQNHASKDCNMSDLSTESTECSFTASCSSDFSMKSSLEKLATLSFQSDNVDRIMQVGDVNGDGVISFEEFLMLLKLESF